MKIIYPEQLNETERSAVDLISVKTGLLRETAEILYRRGIDSAEKAQRFLSAGKKWFYDPFDLGGMKDAVKRIYLARSRGENVLVFGDYDADGICATTVLNGCLKLFGITPTLAIPEREEGYGLNTERILRSSPVPNLVITVDCGISDAEKIELLKSKGVEVIVTDHHEPPAVLPDCICIDPKISGQKYPFKGLCGGGVAYKLGRALLGEDADEFLDLVALATVADSMDLVDENRDLVSEGLKLINGCTRQAFRELIGDANKNITSQTLAFSVAPKINAGGRMGDANSALKLFTAEKDRDIFNLAVKLNEYNLMRQNECEDALKRAREIVYDSGAYKDRIILVKGERWKAGVIGIVAAKLAEVYDKPTIVFARTEEGYKGSARSVDSVNIFDAINSAKDLLLTFGGHAQAVGVSVTEENFEKLRKAVNAYAEENFPERTEKEIYADVKAGGEISLRLAKEIELLEPFGVANRRPLFAEDIYAVQVDRLKENSPHYKFTTDSVEMLDFNGVKDVTVLQSPLKKTIVFELNLSVFRQKESLKGFLKLINYERADFDAIENEIFYRGLSVAQKTDRIKTVATKISVGYGTAYVVSDVKTLDRLPKNIKLDIFPYEITDESGENCVVVSPTFIPDNYRTVVYLDKPFLYNDFNGRAFRISDPIFDIAEGIKTDRDVFADAFKYFADKAGTPMGEILRAVSEKGESARQYVFCLGVFTELGFFRTDHGVIIRDQSVKRPLTESLLYRTAGERKC